MAASRNTSSPHRTNLVVVRAGTESLHLAWRLPAERSWDLATLVYDDELMRQVASGRTSSGEFLIDNRAYGFKFHGIRAFLEHTERIDRYNAIFMPDDDLLIEPQLIDSLFDIFRRSGASFGQPALTWDSYVSHFVTLHNLAFIYRETNFAEVMCPLMTRDFVFSVLPTFTENNSGWGLDVLWAHKCEAAGARTIIVDAIPVKHTRPVGGGGLYGRTGTPPTEELKVLLTKYKLTFPAQKVLRGLPDLDFHHPKSRTLLESFIAGYSAEIIAHPDFARLLNNSYPYLVRTVS